MVGALARDERSTSTTRRPRPGAPGEPKRSARRSRTEPAPGIADTGGASRFFYTAKASTAERDKGLEESNLEPCVKPIDLMRYLVRLASPPGAHDPDESKRPTIIDIFAGSGSTLILTAEPGSGQAVRATSTNKKPR